MTEPGIYFRNLFKPEHVDAWKNQRFTSFHLDVPKEWAAALTNGKNDRRHYKLATSNGLYLPSARDTYFENCVQRQQDWHSLAGETKTASQELCGVCAYDNQAGAYWYGGVKAERRLVAFYGIKVFELGSESNGGVIAVVVKRIGRLMTPKMFITKWCNGIEPLKPKDLPEDRDEEPRLSDDDEDDYGEMPELRRKNSDSVKS
jgi:hypothetical protein